MRTFPYSNLHGHSVFSDGVNTPEEMVLAAMDAGMVTIGFSDHSYMKHDTSYCMRPTAIPAYKREIRRLKEKYRGQIEIVLGLELDALSPLNDREDYEYIIGDIHDLVVPDGFSTIDLSADTQQQCIDRHFGGDPIGYVKAYYDAYAAAAKKLRPDILGHFDLLTKFGVFDESNPAYRRIAVDALHECLKVCNLVEMNTGAISRGYRKLPYPADFILRELLDCGAEVILNSDTHAAATQTCFFDESLEILRRTGFDHLTMWRNGGFVQEAL